MTVGDEQIDPTVVVIVEEFRSPPDVRQTDGCNFCRIRNIGKGVWSIAAVQRVVVVVEVRDKQIQLSIMIIVSQRHTHRSLLAPILINGSSRLKPDLLKRAVTVVVIQEVRR